MGQGVCVLGLWLAAATIYEKVNAVSYCEHGHAVLNFHQTANRAKGKKKTEQNKQKTNTGKGIIYSHGGTGMGTLMAMEEIKNLITTCRWWTVSRWQCRNGKHLKIFTPAAHTSQVVEYSMLVSENLRCHASHRPLSKMRALPGATGSNRKGKITDAQTQGIENLQELSAHPNPHTKLGLQYSGTSCIPQYLCWRALQKQGSFFLFFERLISCPPKRSQWGRVIDLFDKMLVKREVKKLQVWRWVTSSAHKWTSLGGEISARLFPLLR